MVSAILVSFSSVFSLIGAGLVFIAFGSNNWQEYSVKREALLRQFSQGTDVRGSLGGINSSDLYFDRTYGIFRECFPDEVPNGSGTYTDPFRSHCRNIDGYQIPENTQIVQGYTYYELIRMHMMRTVVALYIVGIGLLVVCLFTGICGCWRTRLSLLLTTGIMLMFSALFLIAAVAVWHGVEYIERELINVKPFYKSWPKVLRDNTTIGYGWSYIICWIGIGLILVSSILMLLAHKKLKDEDRRDMEAKTAPYMLPNYHEKIMMMPYAQNYYGGYPTQPMYASYGGAPTMPSGYYGYLNYGVYDRQ